MSHQSNEIDFEPVDIEALKKVAQSPALQGRPHVEDLDAKFAVDNRVQGVTGEVADADSRRREELTTTLIQTPQKMDNGAMLGKDGPLEVVLASHNEELDQVAKFLGRPLTGNTTFDRDAILVKKSENESKITKNFIYSSMFPSGAMMIAGLGAWVLAAEGVGVSTVAALGLPVMSLVALSTVPVTATILVVGGVTYVSRRFLNNRRARKADEAFA
jgi:hypothetical protein